MATTHTNPTAANAAEVTDEAISIRIPRPDCAGKPRSVAAANLVFAAHAESFGGFVRWHRYHALHALLVERMAAAEAAGATDAYTRLYEPQSQIAASYATVAGVRQHAAERFVEEA